MQDSFICLPLETTRKGLFVYKDKKTLLIIFICAIPCAKYEYRLKSRTSIANFCVNPPSLL